MSTARKQQKAAGIEGAQLRAERARRSVEHSAKKKRTQDNKKKK